ncbi:MAG: Gfo/Idh/MocA family oxidoreductase, partial [Alphaproteobacteria bacterium]
MARFRIVGISFDHMHMGDLLRCVQDHPDAEIAGIFDPDRATMQRAIDAFGIPDDRVFTDFDACMAATKPDLAILCAAPTKHADYTRRLAACGVHVLVEKPFASSTADARAMIDAMQPTGKTLAINWPLRWVESHVTAKRLVDEGMIGQVIEIHSYGGNRG